MGLEVEQRLELEWKLNLDLDCKVSIWHVLLSSQAQVQMVLLHGGLQPSRREEGVSQLFVVHKQSELPPLDNQTVAW